MARGWPPALALVALAAGAVACGSDDSEVLPPLAGRTVPVAPTAPDTPTDAPDPFRRGADHDAARLAIKVRETGRRNRPRYSVSAATVPAGLVEIRLQNAGKALHRAQLWRITGERDAQEAARIRGRLPDWLDVAGGVGDVRPNATGRTLQVLAPGRYFVAGTRGNPGTVATFEVMDPGDGELPAAPARVNMLDFSFEVAGLKPGVNSVAVRNVGREHHHAFFVPMTSGATIADVKRFFSRRTSTGPDPIDAEGSRDTAVLAGHEEQVTQIQLRRGRYALICFVRGRNNGPRHIDLGMINEVRVE